MGPSPDGRMWGAGASAQKAFSDPIRLLPEVEHLWSWFPALAMPCKAPVHREQEAAQNGRALMGSSGQGAEAAGAARMSKDALGLSLVSRGKFYSRK